MSEFKLVIAGPGAGKTTNMVQEVLLKLNSLEPYKTMAVITYTKAATFNIHQKLSELIKIPDNVFVGTIHSFLNKFIVIPHSSLVMSDISTDKFFIQMNSVDLVPTNIVGTARRIASNALAQRLIRKGVITFDQTLSLSEKILRNTKACDIISKKLKYVFIDEYQDADNKQFNIFHELYKTNNSDIYCTGDPEQYISGFSSDVKYVNLPIFKTLQKPRVIVQINNNNFRSSQPIINFLNNFNGRSYRGNNFSQIKSSNNSSTFAVKFINYQTIRKITGFFVKFCKQNTFEEKNLCILAKENRLVTQIRLEINSYRDFVKEKFQSDVEIAKNFILTVFEINQELFLNKKKIDDLGFKVLCMKLLRNIKAGEISNDVELLEFLTREINLQIQNRSFVKLTNIKLSNSVEESSKTIVSNIHNAKGLESKCVLCISKTNEELTNWLNTNIAQRSEEPPKNKKNIKDFCRIGYVAFSRAEHILMIACLENLNASNRNKLTDLNVEIID